MLCGSPITLTGRRSVYLRRKSRRCDTRSKTLCKCGRLSCRAGPFQTRFVNTMKRCQHESSQLGGMVDWLPGASGVSGVGASAESMTETDFEPPALPAPLSDDTKPSGPQSRWDALAVSIIKDSALSYSHRCRVRWFGWCVFHWCCGRPMRRCVIEYQDRDVTFGWKRWIGRTRACRLCGRFQGL